MDKTLNNHENGNNANTVLAAGLILKKRIPWNKGKKKPEPDQDGELWCNCDNPKLVRITGYRGQAFCMLCKTPWYH